MVEVAMRVANKIDATVIDMRFVKPIDEKAIEKATKEHDLLVTIEENAILGGAGSACLEVVSRLGIPVRTLQIGLPDQFVEHGDKARLFQDCGMDELSIIERVKSALQV